MISIFIWGFLIVATGYIAQGSGRSGVAWAILGALFGPFALIAVLLMGARA